MRNPYINQTFNNLLRLRGVYKTNCEFGDCDAHMIAFVEFLMSIHRY